MPPFWGRHHPSGQLFYGIILVLQVLALELVRVVCIENNEITGCSCVPIDVPPVYRVLVRVKKTPGMLQSYHQY